MSTKIDLKMKGIFTLSVLRKLNSGNLKTLDDRIKCQKVHYLAQSFNISPNYSYNLYVRGPYSPQLANDLFNVKEKEIMKNFKFMVPDIKENFIRLKSFLNSKSIRCLEILTTFHWLINVTRLNKSSAINKLKELKNPYLFSKNTSFLSMFS
jgi:uncharacterized protein YwgA